MKYPDAAAASGMITRSVPPARASTLPPTNCHAVHHSTSVENVKTVGGEAAIQRVTTTSLIVPPPFRPRLRAGRVALPRTTRERPQAVLIVADRHGTGADVLRESLGIDDLIVSMGAVELGLSGHDRSHGCASPHSVNRARKVKLGLHPP